MNVFGIEIKFLHEIRIGEILQAISLLVAAFALFLNWYQLRKSNIRQSAENLVDLFGKYQEDDKTLDMFRRIDLDETIYDPNKFHGSAVSVQPDRFLPDRLFRQILFDRFDLFGSKWQQLINTPIGPNRQFFQRFFQPRRRI